METRRWTTVLAVTATLGVAACEVPDKIDFTAQEYVADPRYQLLPEPAEVVGTFLFTRQVDEFAPRPGYTYAFNDRHHGVQVEYFAPDGRAHLWYPGNAVSVPSEYRYTGLFYDGGTVNLSRIWFRYPPTSYNPVLDLPGGSWEPRIHDDFADRIISYARGDVFDLAGGRVPYRRAACDLPDPMIYLGVGLRPDC